MKIDKLTEFERETLLRFFLYTMPMALRIRLMAELPVIYRKLLGLEADIQFQDTLRAVVTFSPEGK